MRRLLVIFFVLSITTGYSQNNSEFPKEIKLVFDYILEKDYPEVFKGEPFQIRPISWQIIDIDNDGITEVFLETFPHYRQSPTITIYQVYSNDSVSRIIEGLAPGHLIALSPEDDYFDSHTTGTAVDMTLGEYDYEKYIKLAESSFTFGMSTVLYKNFIHTDQREGKPVFLDLTYLNDYSNETSCANFQFSRPDFIIAGKVEGHESKFFIAKVEKELFCYKIKGIKSNGLLDKEVKVLKVPKDFKEFTFDKEIIKYKTKKNKIKNIEI